MILQIFLFILVPLLLFYLGLFYNFFGRYESLILALILGHSSAGISTILTLSLEKILAFNALLVILPYLTRRGTNKRIIWVWVPYLFAASISNFIFGLNSGHVRVIFDVLQLISVSILVLLFFRGVPNISRFSRAWRNVGVIILLIQLLEISFKQDFYSLLGFSDGFVNYIGSVERNGVLRASSLFAEVSGAVAFASLGLIVNRLCTARLIYIHDVPFVSIILLTGTRLGVFMILLIYLGIIIRSLSKNLLVAVFLTIIFIAFIVDLNILLELLSSITRGGMEKTTLSSFSDSSLFQRIKQWEFGVKFLNTREAIYGLGRMSVLDFISLNKDIYSLDSRLLMFFFFGGFIGLSAWIFAYNSFCQILLSDIAKNKRIYKNLLLSMLLIFFVASAIADYFVLLSLMLGILYKQSNESSISSQFA